MSATDPTPIRNEPHGDLSAFPPPQQPAYVYAPARPTSGFAITALVLGILGGALFAVLFGHLALNDIKATGKDGKGMAVAGLVLGYIETAFWTLIIVFVVIGTAASASL